METWLGRILESERASFCVRFRSGDDQQFASALQEITLHELLRRQGCMLRFHPNVPGTAKQPDFMVQQPNGPVFLLEACTSTHIAGGPSGGTRAHRVRDFLDGLSLQGYLIAIEEFVEGTTDLQQRLLAEHIEDAMRAAAPSYSPESISIPPFITADGWRIKLTALSKSRYGTRHRSVMHEGWSRTWTGPSYPLRDSLKEKGGRYGNLLAMPYVIAVNSADAMLADRDLQDTLFGAPSEFAAPGSPRDHGFWGTAAAPNHTRVSAVLFTKNLWPETLLMGQVYACLYLNPWPAQPYRGVLTKLETFRLENGALRESSGAPLHRLLKLRLRDSSIWG
jgi:hypothetical protein